MQLDKESNITLMIICLMLSIICILGYLYYNIYKIKNVVTDTKHFNDTHCKKIEDKMLDFCDKMRKSNDNVMLQIKKILSLNQQKIKSINNFTEIDDTDDEVLINKTPIITKHKLVNRADVYMSEYSKIDDNSDQRSYDSNSNVIDNINNIHLDNLFMRAIPLIIPQQQFLNLNNIYPMNEHSQIELCSASSENSNNTSIHIPNKCTIDDISDEKHISLDHVVPTPTEAPVNVDIIIDHVVSTITEAPVNVDIIIDHVVSTITEAPVNVDMVIDHLVPELAEGPVNVYIDIDNLVPEIAEAPIDIDHVVSEITEAPVHIDIDNLVSELTEVPVHIDAENIVEGLIDEQKQEHIDISLKKIADYTVNDLKKICRSMSLSIAYNDGGKCKPFNKTELYLQLKNDIENKKISSYNIIK